MSNILAFFFPSLRGPLEGTYIC